MIGGDVGGGNARGRFASEGGEMSSERARGTYGRSIVDAVDTGWAALARNERTLWAAALIAGLSDVLLTYYGLENGLIERNPIGRAAILRAGYEGMVVVKALAVGVGLAWLPVLPDRYTVVVPLCLALPWAIAATINGALIVLLL